MAGILAAMAEKGERMREVGGVFFVNCHYILSSRIVAVDSCHAGSDPTVTY